MEKYGIDSILAMNLTNCLEKIFGPLPKTLFFEYQTINELVPYFTDGFHDILVSLFTLDAEVTDSTDVCHAGHAGRVENSVENSAENRDETNTAATPKATPQAPQQAAPAPVTTTAASRSLAGLARKPHPLLAQCQPKIARVQDRALAQDRPPVTVERQPTSPQTLPNDTHSTQPIAIIGLSGRYPQADNIQAFWHNLRDGKDCITEVPAHRWDWHAFLGKDDADLAEGELAAHNSKWGGFIRGVDAFDPRFFNIAPSEAASIDPQERLFLQHAWLAIEDAGLTRDSLQADHVHTDTESHP